MVAGKRRPPLVHGEKADSGTNQLINADDFTWGGGKFELPLILDAFATPRFVLSFAAGTSSASRRINTCKITWKMSRFVISLRTEELRCPNRSCTLTVHVACIA